jgi:hypothetical protein
MNLKETGLMKQLLAILIAALLSLAFSDTSYAQNVSGTILQNNRPAPHVLVIFSRDNIEVARSITGNDGYYYIRNLPKGSYQVKIDYQGGTKTDSVTVGDGGGKFDFSL